MIYDPIATVEASYASVEDDTAWLDRLLTTLQPLGPDLGGWAAVLDMTDPARFRVRTVRARGPASTAIERGFRLWERMPPDFVRRFWWTIPPVDTMSHRLKSFPTPSDEQRTFLSQLGGDAVSIAALDADGHGVQLGYFTPVGQVPGPRTRHQLRLVSSHVASALRLRVSCAGGTLSDAVLDPSGRVHDARGTAAPAAARRRLAEAVREVERARGRLRRASPAEALSIWKGLVSGEWSLVDSHQQDGRRLVLARRNRTPAPDVKGLRRRESEVLAFAIRGYSNKHIAYLLGLSTGTIAGHLASARAKLGARTRREVVELLGGAGSDERAEPGG